MREHTGKCGPRYNAPAGAAAATTTTTTTKANSCFNTFGDVYLPASY